MAHQVQYFYSASSDSPELDIEHMLSALALGGWQVEGSDWSSSADWEGFTDTNWVAVEVLEGGARAGLAVEVHIRDVTSAEAWADVSRLPGAPAESDATGLCIVTLSGETRRDLFEALQGYWKTDRGAVEFDEVSGFDV